MYSNYYDYTEENNTWTGTAAQYFAVGYNKHNFENLSLDIFTNSNIVINKSIGSSLRPTPGFPYRDLRTSMSEILVSSDILISSYEDVENGVVDGSVIIAPVVDYLPITKLTLGEPYTTPDSLKLLINYFRVAGSVAKFITSNHWVDTVPSVGGAVAAPIPTPSSDVFIYYFLTVRSGLGDPVYELTGADYPDYPDFVNLGVVPPNNQNVAFSEDTGLQGYVSGTANRVENVLTVIWSYEGRPFQTADLTDSTYISGRAEVWSLTNAEGLIPASRRIFYANCCRPEDDLYSRSFTFSGGNPGDRSYTAILQPNGFYKSEFEIPLPFAAAYPNGNFFLKAELSPVSIVPPNATFILERPETCTYSCVDGVCVGDYNGTYNTLEECQNNCVAPPSYYSCVEGVCVPDSNGIHSSLVDCQANCGIPRNYSCSGGVCLEDDNGIYTSLSECESALIPPNFNGGQCDGVNYDVEVTAITNFGVTLTNTTGAIGGPIYSIDLEIIGETVFTTVVSRDVLGGAIYNSMSATGGIASAFISNVFRIDLLTDDCGDLPSSCP